MKFGKDFFCQFVTMYYLYKMKAIIIDDEQNARNLLRSFCEKYFPTLEIVGEAEGVSDAVLLIQRENPQLLLLDIQLKDGNGFEIFDHFKNPTFQVVFCTAYDEFALKAFKYNALDYILKPIDPTDFQNAVQKAMQPKSQQDLLVQMSQLLQTVKTRTTDRLTLPTSDGLMVIKMANIIRIESDGNYATLFLNTKEKIMVIKSLREFEELLPEQQFVRTHQSHIANLEYVKRVSKEDGGYLVMENGDKVLISRRKKEEVIDLIENY